MFVCAKYCTMVSKKVIFALCMKAEMKQYKKLKYYSHYLILAIVLFSRFKDKYYFHFKGQLTRKKMIVDMKIN